MGDVLSPKRRDVIDRLRRRMEMYKRRQNGLQQRYDYGSKAVYEQSGQHALMLRQKWLESKTKAKKQSKSKPDNTGSEVAKQIRKKFGKVEAPSAEVQQQIQHHAENVYRFDDDDVTTPSKATPASVSNKTSNTDGGNASIVSVHINVHQINNSGPQQDQKISTNVTVNQTIRSQSEKESDPSVECKQEPCNEDGGINKSTEDNNNDEDIGDIDDILNAFGKDKDLDLIDELKKFDEIYNKHLQESEGSGESGLSTSESSSMFAPNMYMDSSQGQVRSPPYRGTPGQTGNTAMSEGGMAAETLKQLAAQHQQHQPRGQNKQYGAVKAAIDPFSDMSETGNFNSSRNGYPQEYYNGAVPSSYQGQVSIAYPNKQSVAGYNNNKMTPYTPTTQADAGPSSLQQLQNQVAHFNHGPQMEITQTQHMQLSDGSHRMQMSQTQQIQLRQPAFPTNISLTQQQGFSASPAAMGPSTTQSQSYMGDQMSMQAQMMQNKMHPDQRHMPPQYINRPPPEYKMQHGNGMASGMGANGMGPNPLETIQNMVNQTNTHPNQAYSSVKSESSDMQNGMRTAQMSAMHQQQMGLTMSQAQMNYSNQSMQRQASFPGALAHQMAGRPQRPNTPTYTSAIMRNQRPPNVNIGPDGLNISQPRHPQEWAPRGMNPMAAQAVRPGVPSTSANMMHYRSYSTDGGAAQMQMQHAGVRSMHMDTMQSQQAAMMQNNAHAQQMMMQQQRMQMTQQMSSGSRQTPPYSMPQQGPGPQYPQTSSSQDDILNLLDSAPNQSTDFFDVQTSGGNSEANWYDIEDILGTAVK
ncbi:hypothetical protein MAR_024002 [Mya arenaria]|uniref:Neurogenic mastermind-like N-terminal domain-containing protein n=1 Tax=Mya arenaria TaxID=6604 RepID=A0ABY7DPE7_MYAAR|nr:neurogenic protein mastermind-like [Mya arenaria]XP_052796225.1 neurogenic protein mastermind-like [Mya arenaria]WAQ99569.1 hypothetical protein MAR_023942 [Mya arenaria]WAQ99629.1 hypothetical protein MAR_024002 [Mya arenaria]